MANHQRDPRLEQLWRNHLARQAQSGLSIRGYCRRQRLSEASFYAWRRAIRQRDRLAAAATPAPATPATPPFVPVAVVAAPGPHDAAAIAIRFADGTRLRVRPGCDRRLLAEVLAALRTAATPAVTGSEGRSC